MPTKQTTGQEKETNYKKLEKIMLGKENTPK